MDEGTQKRVQAISKYLIQAINAMKTGDVPKESWRTLFRNMPNEIDFSVVQSYVDMESMSFSTQPSTHRTLPEVKKLLDEVVPCGYN